MAAAPLAIPAIQETEKALRLAKDVLTGDIVTFQGQHFRVHEVKVGRRTERVLTPVDYTVHVNAISIGLGLIGLGIAGVAGIIAWNGLKTGGIWNRQEIQILPGLKDSPYWTALSNRLIGPETCGGLERTANALDAQGVALQSGMTCAELQKLGRCPGRTHASRARALFRQYCQGK